MPSYVEYIRKFVGSCPIILTGASVIVRNSQRHVLFQQRSDNGLWSLPGGMLEMGESLEEAAKREVMEEVGIVVTQLSLIGIVSGKGCQYVYPNGDEVWNVTTVFESEPTTQVPTAKDETTNVAWGSFNASEFTFSPPTASAIFQLGLAD